MDTWLEWMRERLGPLVLVACAGTAGLWWWQERPVSQPVGILVPEEPLQVDPQSRIPWTFRNHTLTPLADFSIRARVLGRERYRIDRPADLSPLDFALGWGPMSDSRNLRSIAIRQSDRWYFWSASRMPISESEIITHSANMHLIPATSAVADRLLAVRKGQLVEIRGQLVRADGKDGWHWVSSLSRGDTGDGSCEVVWVESVRAADH